MLQLSMDTLLAASPLLGHELEDRTLIREAQDPQLIRQENPRLNRLIYEKLLRRSDETRL